MRHPTWKMGSKITIDSATLMNKGFEVIEARWFLGLPIDQIDVVIHRQSIVHCLIEFVDGGMTAYLSTPDMRLPIQQALTHPERLPTSIAPLDLAQVGELTFFAPDFNRFPCLGHGLRGRSGRRNGAGRAERGKRNWHIRFFWTARSGLWTLPA